MIILFVVHRFHPNLFYPVKALVDRGHDVHIIVPQVDIYETLSEDHSIVDPIKINSSELSFKSVYRILKTLKPDLIIQRHSDGKWKLFSLVSLFLGIKRITYDQSTHTGNSIIKQYSRPFRRLCHGLPLQKFTPVLNRGRLGKYTEPFSRYIPFPIETIANCNNRIYAPHGKLRFLFVGKLGERRKNHIQIIEALESLNLDCSLTLVGAGRSFVLTEEKYFDELMQRIAVSTIQGEIKVLSDLPYEQMTRVYLSHDVLVFPAISESLGQSILEALSHGCAVIASDDCGASGYIQDGVNGFIFAHNDVRSLIEKIQILIDNIMEVRRLGSSAINLIKVQHNPGKFVKRIESLVQKR